MYTISYDDVKEDDRMKKYINEGLRFSPPVNHLFPDEEVGPDYKLFSCDNKKQEIRLPLATWYDFYEDFPNQYVKDELGYFLTKMKFTGTLLTKETDPLGRNRDQDVVAKQALSQLKDKHVLFLPLYTGFGKTCTAVYLSCQLGIKTAVVVHNDSVKNSWVEAYKNFTDAKVQVVTGKKGFDPEADVYIIGVFKSTQKYTTKEDIDAVGIGTVIVDEAHLVSCTLLSESLPQFTPYYLLGLSATPDRRDKMHTMLYPYFGRPNTFIKRFEVKSFTVFKYNTKYEPVIRSRTVMGKSILDDVTRRNSLEYDPERQEEIAKIAMDNPTRRIMILSERQKQTMGLYKILKGKGESVGCYYGNMKKFDQSVRILIVGLKKGGVGFDDASRDMLIMASYVDDVRQNEGRIRTNNNIIYHVVDNHPSMETKWKKCKTWYKKRGAKIVETGYLVESSEEEEELPRMTRPNMDE